jgi:hypothetical protein
VVLSFRKALTHSAVMELGASGTIVRSCQEEDNRVSNRAGQTLVVVI